MRKPIVTVTAKDLQFETFTVGGPGGGGKDTSNTGVRWTHKPSGCSAEARDLRSQKANKVSAFEKLCSQKKFRDWLKLETCRKLNIPVRETDAEIRARVDLRLTRDFEEGLVLVEEF